MRDVKPRAQPIVQPPAIRCRNFDEVIQGYAPLDAQAEAQRCILCKNARCQAACPLQNRIPEWIATLQQGRLDEAYRIIRDTSPMPELCSRLCPQERLCEGSCALGIKHESVAIGLLERFVCDQSRQATVPPIQAGTLSVPALRSVWTLLASEERRTATSKKRIAAVGSGPASLAMAQAMARAGHEVTVLERWPRLGGVLRWIPRFKLPLDVLEAHLDMLRGLGVRFFTNVDVCGVASLVTDEKFDAAFLGIGASRPVVPRLPGADLANVLSSTEFLVRVFYDPEELPNGWTPIASLAGQRVVVLGGGDSAMDCVRTALRLGASDVTCVYRRDEANMPGSKKEVTAAKEEGVAFKLLTAPVAFRSLGDGCVSEIECVRMELGPPDASGRRSPMAVPGSNFAVPADVAILAFGYEVEATVDQHPDLMAPTSGTVNANPLTGATPIQGVFAGGDCVTGPNLVSAAARAGLVAVQGMLRYFAGEPWDILSQR